MSQDFDLLIAGGGLVGGSLALALRETGLRIAVIEPLTAAQRHDSAAADRALALSWGSSQILRQLGVWGSVESKAAPITDIHVSDKGRYGKVRLSAQSMDVPALGYVLTARDLEDEISRLLSESAVEMLCPGRVAGVGFVGNSVSVDLVQDQETSRIAARLLVAADGGNSTVRSLLGIGETARDYGQSALVTEVTTALPNNGIAYERFTATGPLAILPLGSRRCSVVWSLKPDDARELQLLPNREFCVRLQAAFGYWLGAISVDMRRQRFPLRLIRAERMVDKRVLLIGNAMHQLHPVAGQGFNLGLRDVALLAERVMNQHRLGGDIGGKDFLCHYAAAREMDLNSVIRFTDGMVRIFSSDLLPVKWARNAGLLALESFPLAKRRLTTQAMGIGRALPRFD